MHSMTCRPGPSEDRAQPSPSPAPALFRRHTGRAERPPSAGFSTLTSTSAALKRPAVQGDRKLLACSVDQTIRCLRPEHQRTARCAPRPDPPTPQASLRISSAGSTTAVKAFARTTCKPSRMRGDMKIDGQCHCGAIRYQAEVDPERVVICHCTDCQMLTGGAFRVSVPAEQSSLKIEGEPKIYRKIAASGRVRRQYFCGLCGSPLFSSNDPPGSAPWGVRWGGIRQRADLRPSRQIWRRSASDWTCAFEGLPAQDKE